MPSLITCTEGAKVKLTCLSRSSVMPALDGVILQHRALGHLAEAEVNQPNGYPGWKPNPSSGLLGLVKRKFVEVLGKEPHIMAIHAGLECGLLTVNYPDLDMVSIGPNLFDVHSTAEKVQISSVQKIWKLLKAILAEAARAA